MNFMSYPFVTLNRKFSLSAMIWSNFFLVSLGLYVFFRAAQRVLNQIDVEKITKIKMKKKNASNRKYSEPLRAV